MVDHIEPVTGPEDRKFWDPTNHQPICRSCHGVKTRREGKTQVAGKQQNRERARWRLA
jgi:5-methylcytosine-specific restriction endonuclease McrA